jgi:hypothetical protein
MVAIERDSLVGRLDCLEHLVGQIVEVELAAELLVAGY